MIEMTPVLNVTRRISALLLALSLVGCATSDATPALQNTTSAQEIVEEPARPPEPEFFVVPKTTKLFLQPDENSKFLLFRSPEEQAKLEEKWKTDSQKWAERTQKKFEKEMEREAKRAKRMRKAEARDEYLEERRQSRAKRLLRDIDRRARRIGEDPSARWLAFRLVERKNGWVLGESLSADEEAVHCYRGGLPGASGGRLRFWVRESELSDVSTKRAAYNLWRGTEVKLASGVVIEDGTAMIDGFRIRMDLPNGDTGKTYTKSAIFEAPYTETVFSEIAYAEGHLQLTKDQSLPFNPFADLYVTQTLKVDSRFYATTEVRCAQISVLTDEATLVPAGRRGAMRLQGAPSAPPPLAPKGTELYTPEGLSLGIAERDFHLGEKTKNEPEGRACFEKSMWQPPRKKSPPSEWLFEVCVDAALVVSE